MTLFTLLSMIAHVMMAAWFMAIVFMLQLYRPQVIEVRNRLILYAGAALMVAWFVLLAISVHDSALIRRSGIANLARVVEFSGAVFLWWWTALAIRHMFRIVEIEKRVIERARGEVQDGREGSR